MKRILKRAFAGFVFAGVLFFAATQAVMATSEYNKKEKEKDSSVSCKTCHTGIPKKGDADKKLNDVGEYYKKNGKLPPRK
ncbi:MAG: hypothetical protein Q7S36_02580 [Candidatus Liptonbacteria bacterium]|nr:hypothetical protein [Candidatus Liptonbacteria bacterium]